jgi:hypothetical protein
VVIKNGASFVRFRGKDRWDQAPQYLAFLKKRPDGRYECVSGHLDPDLSVRQLIIP